MRVIVTRPAHQAQPLADALRAAGFDPVVCPLVAIEPLDDEPIDVAGYDWVIVTSANGADELARRKVGDISKLAAIGDATAAALATHGFPVDFVPTRATQDALVAEFPRPVGRALFVAAQDARRLVESELGAEVRIAYRSVPLSPEPQPEGDFAVLASPSAATAYAALGLDAPVVTIGPQTTAAARSAGLDVRSEATTQDVDGIVAAVREAAG